MPESKWHQKAMAVLRIPQKRRLLTAVALVGVGVLLTVGWVVRSRSEGIKYLTSVAEKGEITATVEATGTINPLTTVPVGSFVSGTVKYVFADFNSRVQAGQVLAQLDPAIYEAQVMQAQGNLSNARASVMNVEATATATKAVIATNQANVVKLRAALQYAGANNQRTADLYKQGIISSDQADLARSNYEQAEAQLRAAEATLNQSQAQLQQVEAQLRQAQAQVEVMRGMLKQAETNLRYTTILSPINGTVVSRNVTVGQSVAASLQAPNVFTIAQDLKRMEVDTQVDESDTGHISIGTQATFRVDAFPNEVFRGQVGAIRLNATIVQNVVTYNVVIDFENPQEKLLPGQTAYVTIPTGHVADSTKIPNAALRFTPQLSQPEIRGLYRQFNISPPAARAGSWQVVWKVGPKNNLVPVGIETGITDYTYTQLMKGDVSPGDALVIAVAPGARSTSTSATAPGFGPTRRRR